MGWIDKAILLVSNLGKGLKVNQVTNLVDVSISNDANNVVEFGSDNGIKVVGTFQYKSIDGGRSDSIYSSTQIIDGGTSNV